MANGKRVKDFRPASRNANKHTARGMGELQKSIQADGWIGAMTTAADGEMIAGSARIETVAQVFGTDAEPIVVESDGTRPVVVVRTDIPTSDDKRAQRLALADNRVHEIDMSWDVEVLAGFDADVLGELWTPEELSDLGQAWADEQRGKQEDAGAQIDKAEELRVKWGVEAGQLWQLGEHRLICGDCTDRAVVDRVMGGEKARLVVSDPPYNVAYSSRGSNKDSWGEIENDDMSEEEFYGWLLLVGAAFDYAMESGASIYLCHGDTDRKAVPFIDLFGDMKWKRSATIIWAKQAASMGWQDYRAQHECLSYGWKEGDKHYFTADRSQTTVWEINRDAQANYQHPTQKPVELFEKAINNSSEAGGVVVDFFLGSGTTLIACERLGRKCRAVEISPAYCAVAIERWAQTTGGTPILANGA